MEERTSQRRESLDEQGRGSPDGAEELSGVLERIIYLNEENHYCIGELATGEGEERVTVAGALPGVQCGETLRLRGFWKQHPQYGRQFGVKEFRSSLPSSVYGIRKYLGSGLVPGIGKVYANKIVDHFGTETMRVISDESARLREVPGIGKKRATEIKAAWDSQRSMRDLLIFLQTYGVSVSQCMRLLRAYGNEARAILQSEPYRVAREIDGIGFRTADKIAINLGFANDSPQRLRAGLIFALRELEDEGHTGYPREDLLQKAAEMLEADAVRLSAAIDGLLDEKELSLHPLSGLVQLPQTGRAEETIAESLGRIGRVPSCLPAIRIDAAVEWAQERAGFSFAVEQAAALRMALGEKVSVITGGPGTGKTTILRALVEILRAKKVRIVLASPTGRAAQRMSESTRHPASTIHRLLKFDPQAGGFTVNASAPLAADYLIVDEASMLDLRLAAALFRALPAAAHLLLVGDIDQLPSVGCGNVLKDVIECGAFGVTALNRIFRQREDSSIVSVAHRILQGESAPPMLRASLAELDPRHDLHFICMPTPSSCLDAVVDLCRDFIPRHYTLKDPLMDIQVLAPMHKGVAGIENLNRALQKALNPGRRSVSFGQVYFHEGDKVIQTRNNYDKGIFNGDLGTVTRVNPDAGTLAADFDGREIDFERMDLGELSPAFAISIHKSQGSEFSHVVIPLLKQHFMLLQRNLLYTGITRGKRKVFIVGDPEAYAMAVRNNESRTRRTALKERILAV